MSSACHNLLLSSLSTYYKKNSSHRKTLKDIIDGNSLLSLRIIDWFVTHYAKTNQIIYWIDNDKNIYYDKYPSHINNINLRKFHLYMEYRAQLQSYTKLFFDPFRRHERITFILEQDPLISIETTVGQLNFFRWAFQNHIFTYILDHLQSIEDKMASYQKQLKNQNKKINDVTPSQSLNTSINTNKDVIITNINPCKNKSKKKDTHIGNIVLHTPCFIRFD
jgi:hypothetical protein